jgi:threonine dehydrogenase-like Zn-dependent dehydrogenase
MKAGAVFPEQRKVEVVALDEPKISSSTQVKLRMLEVGVCGTDREICHFHYGTPPEGFEFLVLGHESLGEVVETGSGVTRVRCGDLVTPMVRHACPHADCAACRSGRQDFCYTGDFQERGIKQVHGFMTDFVVDDEKYLHPVPPELREVAVLVEPLTTAEKALLQIHRIQQRLPWNAANNRAGACGRAVVLGAGPIGLLGAMALVNAGYRTYLYSREPSADSRGDLAASFGAEYVSSHEHSIPQLGALAGNVDVIYEATGASQTAFEIFEGLGANGVYVLTGVPRHGQPVSIHTERMARNLVLKNQVILGTVNAGRDAFEASIRDLGIFYQRWPAAVRALITRRYPLDRFRESILESSGIKNVIVLDGNI